MKINRLIWLLIFVFNSSTAFSQLKSNKCVVQTSATGESLKEAYTNAVNQGFFDLIAKCGSGVNIGSTSYSIKESTLESSKQQRYRSVILGLDGLISKFEVIDSSSRIRAGGRYFEVEITCKGHVYAEERSTKKGFMEVYGLKSAYYHGKDALDIEIFCEIRSYVYVFQLYNDELNLLYPDPSYNDPDFIINANERVDFPPQSLAFDFKIQNDFDNSEVFDLIFVAASRPIATKSQFTIEEIVELYSGLNYRKDIKIVKVAITR